LPGGFAGVGFNVVLGFFAWNLEGILGGRFRGLSSDAGENGEVKGFEIFWEISGIRRVSISSSPC